MADFFQTRAIKAVRKARRCDECGLTIEVGSPAVDYAQVHEGDFFTGSCHADCSAWASRAIQPNWDGVRPFLNDFDPELDEIDAAWVSGNPPPQTVRVRMSSSWELVLPPPPEQGT